MTVRENPSSGLNTIPILFRELSPYVVDVSNIIRINTNF